MKVLIFREQISGCNDHVNALMRLYANVANRGDVTKEMIFNALHNGFYSVKIIPKMGKTGKSENLGITETVEISLKYMWHQKESTYSFDDIQDLRGRALLLINSIDKEKPQLKQEMEAFIKEADLINQIHYILQNLSGQGVFGYSVYDIKVNGYNAIQDLKDNLVADLNE